MTTCFELLAIWVVYIFVKEFIRISLEDKEDRG